MPKKKSRKPARSAASRRPSHSRRPTKQASLPSTALRKHDTEIGISVHDNKPCRLVLVENALDGIEPTNHAAALAYAQKMGGDLPSRIDGLVLFARAKAKFKTDNYYWTNEESAGYSSYAWLQWFGNGLQYGWHKSDSGRVCVVRRLPL